MAKFEVFNQVDVSLPGHHYPIFIGRNGLGDAALIGRLVSSKQALIVTNQTVAKLYLAPLQSTLAAIQCDVVVLADGEEYKNQQSLDSIYDALVANRHHRDTTLIALGGGVVGDITGFAASTYQRGVKFVQIPTTLLAQIDASVGGKTGINHPQGKNMIGSFYQPEAVLIDMNTLASLPAREFNAGLAEMIKYGFLAGGEFLSQLVEALKEGLNAHSAQLPMLIAACCRIKAAFVEGDEKEQGKRALLNLGHTFAHALESYSHYQTWLHGEAVAIGLYCAALLSYNMDMLDEIYLVQVEQMLKYAGLPHKIPSTVDLASLRDLMGLDKKIKNNTLRFVVIKKPGDCYLDNKISEDCLQKTLITAVEGE